MSTPATRRSERKRNPNTRIADLDSSPTQRPSKAQPATKKRKASAQVASRATRRPRSPEAEAPETVESSDDETAVDDDDDDDDSDNQDAADLVIPYLGVSADPVAVADEYTNSKTEERYGEGNINAFAKLCGRDWTYYLQSPQILFGRAPDANSRHGTGAESATHDDSPPIQIDLGPSKVVSRVHAELKFSQSDDRWHVHVYGRNGVRVDEENIRKGHARPIKSGTVITIAGTEMLFQAPSGKSEIHRIFIDRILGHQNNEGLDRELGSAYRQALPDRPLQDMTSIPPSSQHYGYSRPGFNTQTTIARAPLDLARPVTPEPSPPKRAAPGSAKKRSPGYKRGIMMESTEQIDYALDSSRDIKPGCSYAAMITWAIISTPEQALSLSGIYSWIKSHYSYYRVVNSGWQNSIRHNLSLNPAFDKVPRRPDEPGKGMKWRLVPEHREATLAQANKNASKGGGRVSSAPGSPAEGATSSGFLPANGNGMKSSPTARTPPLSSYPPAQTESFTPSRGPQAPIYAPTQGGLPVLSDESSPLPRRRTNGQITAVDSSPTLTSGAWAHDAPMRTPAPRPHNLNVPQPNTVKLPTSHMADSSPAPFWRFENIGSTPARPWPEISPLKNEKAGEIAALQSSSPPPVANGIESPTRRAKSALVSGPTHNIGRDDEDGEIDITRGFTKISSYHQQRSTLASNSVAS